MAIERSCVLGSAIGQPSWCKRVIAAQRSASSTSTILAQKVRRPLGLLAVDFVPRLCLPGAGVTGRQAACAPEPGARPAMAAFTE
jgi:hypothetical protein